MLSGPLNRSLFKQWIAEANGDPKLVDEHKERIKQGKRPPLTRPYENLGTVIVAVASMTWMLEVFKERIFGKAFYSSEVLSTIGYVGSGIFGGVMAALFGNKTWTETNYTGGVIAGFISSLMLIMVDKVGLMMMVTQGFWGYILGIPSCVAKYYSRKYKKTPSRLVTTGKSSRSLIAAGWFIWWMLILASIGMFDISGSTNSFSSIMGYKEIAGVLSRSGDGAFDIIKRGPKFQQLYADFYVEVYYPYTYQEMSPLKARNVLGVDIGASDKDLKKAYRAMSREWHPDKYQGDDEDYALDMQAQLNIAVKTLEEYDNRYKDGIAYSEDPRESFVSAFKQHGMGMGEQEGPAGHKKGGGDGSGRHFASTDNVKVIDPNSDEGAKMKKMMEDLVCKPMLEQYATLYEEGLVDYGGPDVPCKALMKHSSEMDPMWEAYSASH